MLENVIKEHAAALTAVASAIRELAAAVNAHAVPAVPSASSAPVVQEAAPVSCPPPAYGPASPVEEAAAVAHADALSGVNASCAIVDVLPSAAPAPAEAPASAPASVTAGTVEAPAPAPVTQPAPVVAPVAPMSLEQLRGLCIRAGQAGLTGDVLTFIRARGAAMLADLPQSEYGALISFLASKGVQ